MRLYYIAIIALLVSTSFAANETTRDAPLNCATSSELAQARQVIDMILRRVDILTERDTISPGNLKNETGKLLNVMGSKMDNATAQCTQHSYTTQQKVQSAKYELWGLAMLCFLIGLVTNQMLVAKAYRQATLNEKRKLQEYKQKKAEGEGVLAPKPNTKQGKVK